MSELKLGPGNCGCCGHTMGAGFAYCSYCLDFVREQLAEDELTELLNMKASPVSGDRGGPTSSRTDQRDQGSAPTE